MSATEQTANVKDDIEASLADLDNLEQQAQAATDEDLDEIEEIVGDDDLDAQASEEDAVEEPDEADNKDEQVEASEAEPEVSDDEVNQDDLVDLELAIDKSEAYANQESTAIETVNSGEVTSGKGAKSKGTKRTTAPATPKDLSSVDADFFVLIDTPATLDQDEKDRCKKNVIAARPSQKKVAEKFDNVFLAMAAGKAPSKYVMTAAQHLAANPTTDSAGLIAAFRASGVADGTARSQAGQMMALFPVLGIAKRSGKTLAAINESRIAAYLKKLTA